MVASSSSGWAAKWRSRAASLSSSRKHRIVTAFCGRLGEIDASSFESRLSSVICRSPLPVFESKGVEFDDVVILNGGWDRPSKGEDPDAPRRLFYVAMTRARRSLAIIAEGNHPFVPQRAEYMLRRAAPTVTDAVAVPTALYQVPNLKTAVTLPATGSRACCDETDAAIGNLLKQ